MSDTDRLVSLQCGIVVPVEAYRLALQCDELGIRLRDDRGVLDVTGPLTPEIAAALKRFKWPILTILRYHPSDAHLRDAAIPFPHHGPLLVSKGGAR